MNNKGTTLIGLLATLVISTIVLLTLSRVYILIINIEKEAFNNARFMSESSIIMNDIQKEFHDIAPASCNDNVTSGVFLCEGVSPSSFGISAFLTA